MDLHRSEALALARVEVLRQRQGIWTGVQKVCTHYGCPHKRCRAPSHAGDWRWRLLHDPGDRPPVYR
jgi:Rieske Fe-S protein